MMLRFSPQDIWASLNDLQRLSEVPAEDARLWQAWRNLPAIPTPTGGTVQSTAKLPYQKWREVQPDVAVALKDGSPRLLALVGRGGLGKSVLLGKLLEEAQTARDRTLWLTGNALRAASAPDQVGRILSLGAWSSATEGRGLRVFIDGFENAASGKDGLQKLVASLESIDGTASVTVALSVRDTSWSELAGTQETLEQWTSVWLHDWDEARVAALVRASQRPHLAPELLRLLRTPLLLDLFLRTFGIEETVPEGLQTRHGVLRAYWERRVLPTNKPLESVARNEKLLLCCAREAEGHSLHHISDPAMEQLSSEGLFVYQQGGWSFRHPLLRDFSLMRWAAIGAHDARDIVRKLANIRFSITRWGSLRAMFEAVGDTSSFTWASAPPINELIDAMRDGEALLMRAAEILGELEDPSAINLEGILMVISTPERAVAFVDRLLELAKLASNEGWLRWLATLPSRSDWPERTFWVGSSFLACASELLEIFWREKLSLPGRGLAPVASQVALRLRNWSAATKFSTQINWFRLMPLVADHEPTQATLDWLIRHVDTSLEKRWGVLKALPLLIGRARESLNGLDGKALVELYRQAAGLRRDACGLRHDESAPPQLNAEHERTSVALLGHAVKQHQGLLRMAPELFLPVAFDMLSGLAEDERVQRERVPHEVRLGLILESFSAHFQPEPPSAKEAELESKIQDALGPPMDEASTWGYLIDDTNSAHYEASTSPEREEIINALQNMLRAALDGESAFIENLYWPTARVSHSSISWLLLLELLAGNSSKKPALLDELISLRPLYSLSTAWPYLHKAIASRWPHLDEALKKTVLGHIQSAARAPERNALGYIAVIASAIPLAERPSWAQPSFDWYQEKDLDPIPRRFEPNKHFFFEPLLQQDEKNLPGDMSPWAKVMRWGSGGRSTREEAPLHEALFDLKVALATELPPPTETAQRPGVVKAMRAIFARLVRSQSAEALPPECALDAQLVQRLVQWGLDVARQCDIQELEANKSPVEIAHAPNIGASHPWVIALEFLNAVMAHPAVLEDLSLNRQLFEEIGRRASQPSPTLAWYLFRALEVFHWLRPGSAGRELLQQLVLERVHDPGALTQAFSHVWFLGADEREKILRFWLMAPKVFPEGSDLEEFAGKVGMFLGEVALHQEEGEPNNLRRLTDELLASPPDFALLAQSNHYNRWAVGVAFGAKQWLLDFPLLTPTPQDRLQDFHALMDAIWSRVGIQAPDQQAANVVSFMLHPLRDPVESKSREGQAKAQRLWFYLEPLLRRVIREGKQAAVFSLVLGLNDAAVVAALGTSSLKGVIEELHDRAIRLGPQLREPLPEPSHSWLSIYGWASEMLASIAQSPDASPDLKDRLLTILHAWADWGIPKASEMARTILNSRH
ncbi:hypothetical protein [Archangium sp.]|uniref:hypothetical protein n=1 Tax=Archangium sp. TaxID=1872627 RepID=UPI002D50B814|nr:hypothetical protein [Archangium sp.]HYO51843.1 hypothetical protein [Archangium sp.]